MALLGIEEGIQSYAFQNFWGQGPTTFNCHLYTNNHAPAAGDTWKPLGTFWTECTDASYAAVTLVAGNWTFSSVAGPKAQAAYPTITFLFTAGSISIYGYVLTDFVNNKACIAEQFAGAPITFGSSSPLYLTLQVTLS